ncbi:MAG: tail fiber protein [Saprospiraceae bacterium]
MANPFLCEIKIISWNFAPQGWAFCNGQLLPINQNQALFALMGTMYGGNGQTNFALPDLKGKAPIHEGNGFNIGQFGGEINHTVTASEMPQHNHLVNVIATNGSSTANVINPSGASLATSAPAEIYRTSAGNPSLISMTPATIGNIGGSQSHNNMQPFLVLNFIVALVGIFPSQN